MAIEPADLKKIETMVQNVINNQPIDPDPYLDNRTEARLSNALASRAVSGSRGGNAALASLLAALQDAQIIVDQTTA